LERIETPRAEDINPELAVRALKLALHSANLSAKDLGYIISHTTTPHTLLPPNISWVVDLLSYPGVYGESKKLKNGDKVLILGAETTKFLYGGFVYHHFG
jgi:3-oxoacyl-[acyl-carrier-protein] synthase III